MHQIACQLASNFRTLGNGQQHHKFIATPARQHVRFTQIGAKNIAHVDQELISGFMAMQVVDLLEIVQVDEQQGKFRVCTARAPDFLIDSNVEMHPVGQTGQGIMHSHVADAFFLLVRFGYIAQHAAYASYPILLPVQGKLSLDPVFNRAFAQHAKAHAHHARAFFQQRL